MKKFLGDVCRVKNFHFMLQILKKKVNTPEEMVEILVTMFIRDLSSRKDSNREVSKGKVRDESKSDAHEPRGHHALTMVHRRKLT